MLLLSSTFTVSLDSAFQVSGQHVPVDCIFHIAPGSFSGPHLHSTSAAVAVVPVAEVIVDRPFLLHFRLEFVAPSRSSSPPSLPSSLLDDSERLNVRFMTYNFRLDCVSMFVQKAWINV